MKNEKGITLISLVVTITVMIILAGVTIQASIGDNKLISRTQGLKQNTVTQTEEANTFISGLQVEEDSNSAVQEMVDNVAPVVSVFEVTANGTQVDISVNVTDAESGIKSIKYSKDNGETWENDYKDIKAKKYKFTDLESGKTYTIKIEVEDNSGNKTEKSTTIAIQ